MTPSLGNFLSSLVAGGIVVLAIGIVLIVISKSDRLHETLNIRKNFLIISFECF
jgi:hypothetical protein